MAAACIDIDAGPRHVSRVKPDTTARYAAAAALNSAPNPSQTEAAVYIGPEPAPTYIRVELISGGSAAKSISVRQSLNWARPHARRRGCGWI